MGGGGPLYKKYATLTPEKFHPEGLEKMEGAKNSAFEQKILVFWRTLGISLADFPAVFL